MQNRSVRKAMIVACALLESRIQNPEFRRKAFGCPQDLDEPGCLWILDSEFWILNSI
jgi:hypothetical protein